MIYVSPLSALEACAQDLRPSHVVSLLDPETIAVLGTPPGIAPKNHLKVSVNDIAAPINGHVHPDSSHVEEIIAFLSGWQPDAPLLIHCWAGISRSTATAFTALCMYNEDACEFALARLIRERGAHASPNRLIVAHADRVLGRDGRMIDAVDAMTPPRATYEGVTFSLPHAPDVDLRSEAI